MAEDQDVGGITLESDFLHQRVRIEINGPNGNANLEQTYLAPLGYRLAREGFLQFSNFSSDDNHIRVTFEEKQQDGKTTKKGKAYILLSALHEIGHMFEDPSGDESHFLLALRTKAQKEPDGSTNSRLLWSNRVAGVENSEKAAWLHVPLLMGDIKKRTGYDLRQEFNGVEEFIDRIKYCYGKYRSLATKTFAARNLPQDDIDNIFSEDHFLQQIKELWISIGNDTNNGQISEYSPKR